MIKQEVYRSLGLKDEEYQRILDILKREPTPTELAMYSVEWSEHCGYPRSRKYLKILPKTGKYQALIGEDSGGFILDDLAIIFKTESHNHPSQVEPKQGAATGVGGIIRDIFTAGARPIACLDSLRFGPLDKPYNRYLLRGVVEGIQFYGNCVGIPTVGGDIYFDECYTGNCLVNAMCIGIAPKDKIARARANGVGNPIMYVGSSTGRDGIGGCSVLASAEFKEGEEKRPTVQIGDPFTEKCLIEATLEALKTGHIIGIKDMGAAGLTCSTSEMAFAGDSGIEIELQKVPRREEGMEPYEVMMSESQERMLVCIKKGHEEEISKIFEKWDLHGVVIGHVVKENVVRIKDKGVVVGEMTPSSLADAPLYDMPYEKPASLDEVNRLDLSKIKEPSDYSDALLKLLKSPTIASKEWIFQQYDHMVQTNTVVLPGSDAAVIRLKDTNKAIAATSDCNSRYCYLNPYRGAQIAVAEAARNLVCSGADPAAVTDCLNFANPEKPDRYWHFKNCIEGIADACRSFNVAVVSGNVSFYNENPRGPINPTPTIGMVGVIDDMKHVCTQGFKEKESAIVLLGAQKEELGGSEYLAVLHNMVRGDAPQLDLNAEKALQVCALDMIRSGFALSSHDCSEGGLAVCIAESCFTGKNLIGAKIILKPGTRNDALLFGETQSRIVISVRKSDLQKAGALARSHNVPFEVIGTTGGDNFEVTINNKKLISISVDSMNSAWRNSIAEALEG